MNVGLAVPIADSWGMHNGSGGWWILGAALMMLFMGGMMWMMMRGMSGGSSAPPDAPAVRETPVEILDRRFAEGEISEEDYRARRELLVDKTAEANGAHEGDALRSRAT